MADHHDAKIHDLASHRLPELFPLLLEEQYAEAADILRSARHADPRNIYLIALDKQLERLRAFATDPRDVSRKSEILQSLPVLIERATERFRVRSPQDAPILPLSPPPAESRGEAVEKLKKRYFHHADEQLRKGNYDAALVEIRRVFILEPENRVAIQYERTIRQLKGAEGEGSLEASLPSGREIPSDAVISAVGVSESGTLTTIAEEPAPTPETGSLAEALAAGAHEDAFPEKRTILMLLFAAVVVGGMVRGGVAVYEMFTARSVPATAVGVETPAVVKPREDPPVLPLHRRPIQGPSKQEFLARTAAKTGTAQEEVRRNEEGNVIEGPDGPQEGANIPKPAESGATGTEAELQEVKPIESSSSPLPASKPAKQPEREAAPDTPAGALPRPAGDGLPIENPAAVVRLAAPDVSRLRGTSTETGSVSLRVKVDETGSPVQATVLQSDDSRLNPVALDAVLRSQFAPARTSAGPVSSWITVTMKVEPER